MSDELSCTVTRGDLVVIRSSLGVQVALLGRAYPNSDIQLRIDNSTARSAESSIGFVRNDADAIVEELKQGSRLRTRLKEWPSGRDRDSEQSLLGFEAAFDLMNRVFEVAERPGRGF